MKKLNKLLKIKIVIHVMYMKLSESAENVVAAINFACNDNFHYHTTLFINV